MPGALRVWPTPAIAANQPNMATTLGANNRGIDHFENAPAIFSAINSSYGAAFAASCLADRDQGRAATSGSQTWALLRALRPIGSVGAVGATRSRAYTRPMASPCHTVTPDPRGAPWTRNPSQAWPRIC